jgi:hypothetical protein
MAGTGTGTSNGLSCVGAGGQGLPCALSPCSSRRTCLLLCLQVSARQRPGPEYDELVEVAGRAALTDAGLAKTPSRLAVCGLCYGGRFVGASWPSQTCGPGIPIFNVRESQHRRQIGSLRLVLGRLQGSRTGCDNRTGTRWDSRFAPVAMFSAVRHASYCTMHAVLHSVGLMHPAVDSFRYRIREGTRSGGLPRCLSAQDSVFNGPRAVVHHRTFRHDIPFAARQLSPPTGLRAQPRSTRVGMARAVEVAAEKIAQHQR